jgi:hypothetical protein
MVITDDPTEPPPVPDLLPRASAGDADAFCRLVEPLQSALFKQTVLHSEDRNKSEDILIGDAVETSERRRIFHALFNRLE